MLRVYWNIKLFFMRKLIFCMTLLLGLNWAAAVADVPAEHWSFKKDSMRLEIADASTWVSIAKVNLKVSELDLEEGRLRGNYDLRVPIRSSKNEAGLIDLKFPQEISDMRVHGGKMIGVGIRHDGADGPRPVTCEIIPNEGNLDQGKIILKIDTGERVLTFKSTYAVVYDHTTDPSS